MKVYPNQATELLYIESDVTVNIISILSSNGREIRSSAVLFIKEKIQIAILEKLVSGVYFIIIEANVSKHTKKNSYPLILILVILTLLFRFYP